MKYLIKDTTPEERKAFVEKAIAISNTGTVKPSLKAIALYQEYIDGKKELDEILKELVGESK